VKEIHRNFEGKGETEGLAIKKEVVIGKKEIVSDRKNCAC
jgi:hypothetical protein